MVRTGAVAAGRYRMAQHGQPAQRGGLPGMFILQDNVSFQVYKPSWMGTRTVFRPFPGKNPEAPMNDDRSPNWDPFRLSNEPLDFGDWIRRYDMVFGFGTPGVTFITRDPRMPLIDEQRSPVLTLVQSIKRAVKAGQCDPSWNPLVLGVGGNSEPLCLPRDGYVMQGILMEHKSVPQDPPRGSAIEHTPVLLLMTQSAGETLLDKLEERDAQGNFAWPDITDLAAGRFVQFHQAGTQRSGNPAALQTMSGSGQRGDRGMNMNRYEVEILDSYNGISPTYPEIVGVASAHVQPWDDIIRIPTAEEQIRIICNAGIPAAAIVYALRDAFGEMIPAHVFDQARAQGVGGTPSVVASPMMRTAASTPAAGNGMVRVADPSMPAVNSVPAPAPAAMRTMSPAAPQQVQAASPVATPPAVAEAAAGAVPPVNTVRSQRTQDALNKARQRLAAHAAE